MKHAIQTMEGDSVIAPINTNQLSLEGNSRWAVNTRNDQDTTRNAEGNPDWEHLKDFKIPSKTWDIVVSRRRSLLSKGDINASDEGTTMSGQDEG